MPVELQIPTGNPLTSTKMLMNRTFFSKGVSYACISVERFHQKNGRAALLQSAQALGIAAQPGLNTPTKKILLGCPRKFVNGW